MEGEDERGAMANSDSDFHLGAVLTRLGQPEPADHGPAVETIRATIEEDPGRCLPTVPKLRSLLGDTDPGVQATVATCLRTMAVDYPDDVAPSVPAIVDCLTQGPPQATADPLVDCLESVAEERPDLVAKALADRDPRPEATDGADGVLAVEPEETDALPEPTTATTIEIEGRLLEVRYGD